MNTDTPAPAVAQVKTLDERIAEVHAIERRHRAVLDEREKEMQPYKEAYNTALSAWCKHYDRLKVLEDIKKEEGSL